MKTARSVKQIAISTIKKESKAISSLSNSINDDFVKCVELIYRCKGRVIVTGIGKSAIIGSKLVATLNSTGTPAVFMHAADAIHGDLGMVQKGDIVVCLSKSGETPEIKVLVPLLKIHGESLIAIVGNTRSYLALHADLVLEASVAEEACPNNLAPTSSTTAQLVMCDALAVCILERRGFTKSDFAKFHPGGAIGKELYLKVSDLCKNNQVPKVKARDPVKDVILEISSKRLGATAVVDGTRLAGIITDGDLRRMLVKNTDFIHLSAKDIMTKDPKTIEPEMLVVDALALMRKNNITQLLVMKNEKYVGVIHLHDILKEGII